MDRQKKTENGIFQIQDDQGAEWALKKIREPIQ